MSTFDEGGSSARELALLRHFVATLAYRAQKALRDAPREFAGFEAGNRTRTPVEIVRHMASLMGYVRTFWEGGSYPRRPPPLPTFDDEVARFHEQLDSVSTLLAESAGDGWPTTITPEQLLQGPLADAMTHVGQLAILRRLAGAPVPPENFIHADVDPGRLGPEQPPPARPDEHWPEAP